MIAMNRHIKQFIYGTLYLVILGFIGWGIYAGAKPTPTCFDSKQNQGEEEIDCGGLSCLSCAIKKLRPILARPVTLFHVRDTRTAILEFQNPNATYGASEFRYTLTITGASGEAVRTIEKTSFIYPTEIKYIFESDLGNNFPSSITAEAMIKPESIVWKPISEFPLPRMQTRSVRVMFDPAKGQAVVTGAISNENPFVVTRATIVGIALGAVGNPLAASKTLVQDVSPGEERAFRIVIPEIPLGTFSERDVKLFVEAAR